MVSGTTISIINWNDNEYCPECNSNNGYNDVDMSRDEKSNTCRGCKSRWKKSDLFSFEQHINFSRYKKLNQLLE